MKRLLIIGCGGVGSYLANSLYNYEYSEQLLDLNIKIADGDEVNLSNLTYQNFSEEDILDNKAKVLANKYNFLYIDRFITFPEDYENLKTFDFIISAVDSAKFRREFFTFMDKNEIYWMDLRSTGKLINVYTKHKNNDLNTLLSSLPKTGGENSSCQLKFELESGIVQGGNRIVAEIGAQYVLNWYRGQSHENPSKFVHSF